MNGNDGSNADGSASPRAASTTSSVRPIVVAHDDPEIARLESEVAALGMLEAAVRVAVATCGRAAVLQFVVAKI